MTTLEEIRAPLAVVQRLLSNNQTASPNAVQDHFAAVLAGRWGDVPLLNAVAIEQLRPGSLVRFRCMVQNTYDPEWFLGEYDHVNAATGERVRVHAQFADAVDVPRGWTPDMSDSVARTMERLPLHCMSIPHESAWVSAGAAGITHVDDCPAQRAKRSHDDAMDADCDAPGGPAVAPNSQSGMECGNAGDEAKRLRNGSCCTHGTTVSGAGGGRPALVPGASQVRHAAIVKVYGEDSSIKVNATYEFVGIYCLDPVADAPAKEPGMVCSFTEDGEVAAVQAQAEATGPASGSVLPRIHAVTFRALTPAWNPALEVLAPEQQALKRTEVASVLPAMRASILKRLATAVCGDALAAEYVLCHMLSRVFHRAQGVPVGKLSLALTGLSAAAAGTSSAALELSAVMSDLRPAVAYVPMTVKNLSAKLMAPRKDYDTEMLHFGDLQMSPATQVICDETVMEAGQLNEKGVKNLHCLQQLLTFQHIIFDFSFYQMEFASDIPILVTSQGKPLLNTDIVLKVLPDQQAEAAGRAESQEHPLTAEMAELCRIYMGMARATDVSLPDELCKVAEDKFVEARKADPKVDQDTLGRWLTMAKLLAASFGASEVKREHWDHMLAMEAQRAARVQ